MQRSQSSEQLRNIEQSLSEVLKAQGALSKRLTSVEQENDHERERVEIIDPDFGDLRARLVDKQHKQDQEDAQQAEALRPFVGKEVFEPIR